MIDTETYNTDKQWFDSNTSQVSSTSTGSKLWSALFPITSNSNYIVINTISSTISNRKERHSLELLKLNKLKLKSFLKLEENWNGYDGEFITEELIKKTEKIISSLDYQPQIFPTGRGTIQLEQYKNDENLVEAEVSLEQIDVYSIIKGIENECEVDEKQLNKLFTLLNE